MTHDHESPMCLLFPRAYPSVIPRRWMRFRPTYLANSRCHASWMSSTSWSSWALVDRNTSSNSHVLIDGLHFKKTIFASEFFKLRTCIVITIFKESKSKLCWIALPCIHECWLHFSRKPFWTSSPWQVTSCMSHPGKHHSHMLAAPCYVATVWWEAHWCPESVEKMPNVTITKFSQFHEAHFPFCWVTVVEMDPECEPPWLYHTHWGMTDMTDMTRVEMGWTGEDLNFMMFCRLLQSDPKLPYLSFVVFCCLHTCGLCIPWAFLNVNNYLQGLNKSLRFAPTLASLTTHHWRCKASLSIFARVMQKDLDTHSAGCGRQRSSKGLVLSRWTSCCKQNTQDSPPSHKIPAFLSIFRMLLHGEPSPSQKDFEIHHVKISSTCTKTITLHIYFTSSSQHPHTVIFWNTKAWGVCLHWKNLKRIRRFLGVSFCTLKARANCKASPDSRQSIS